MKVKLNERAAEVHRNNHKWWINIHTGEPLVRNKHEMLMLVVTELAEAAEGERKNLMDDHLPHRKMAEVEIADAYIRMLDFAAGHGYPILEEPINAVWDEDIEEAKLKYGIPLNKLQNLMQLTKLVSNLDDEISFDNDPEQVSELISIVIFGLIVYSRVHGYDIEGAYQEKNEYNKTRKDHSIEERLKENGKKV